MPSLSGLNRPIDPNLRLTIMGDVAIVDFKFRVTCIGVGWLDADLVHSKIKHAYPFIIDTEFKEKTVDQILMVIKSPIQNEAINLHKIHQIISELLLETGMQDQVKVNFVGSFTHVKTKDGQPRESEFGPASALPVQPPA